MSAAHVSPAFRAALDKLVDRAAELALLCEEVGGGYHEGGVIAAGCKVNAVHWALGEFLAACSRQIGARPAANLTELEAVLIARMAVNATEIDNGAAGSLSREVERLQTTQVAA